MHQSIAAKWNFKYHKKSSRVGGKETVKAARMGPTKGWPSEDRVTRLHNDLRLLFTSSDHLYLLSEDRSQILPFSHIVNRAIETTIDLVPTQYLTPSGRRSKRAFVYPSITGGIPVRIRKGDKVRYLHKHRRQIGYVMHGSEGKKENPYVMVRPEGEKGIFAPKMKVPAQSLELIASIDQLALGGADPVRTRTVRSAKKEADEAVNNSLNGGREGGEEAATREAIPTNSSDRDGTENMASAHGASEESSSQENTKHSEYDGGNESKSNSEEFEASAEDGTLAQLSENPIRRRFYYNDSSSESTVSSESSSEESIEAEHVRRPSSLRPKIPRRPTPPLASSI